MRRTFAVLVALTLTFVGACGDDDDGDEDAATATTATTTQAVAGPKIEATAPATIAEGETLNIDVVATGVTIVKADGDTSGTTGHFHAFVDKEPVAGQAIPIGDPKIIHWAASPIPVTGLTEGKPTIRIVLGNGSHVPFDPPVTDELTVTVT